MMDRQLRLTRAQLRMALRDIDVQIQASRHEQRFYSRLGFEREWRDMQIVELLERKRGCEQHLQALDQRARRRGAGRGGLVSWIVFSPLLLLVGVQSLLGRRLRASA